VNLLRIAARIAAVDDTAGESLNLMKEMGYDPVMLVYNAGEIIGSKVKWPASNRIVSEAIVKAWMKAGLPDPKLDSRRMEDEPRQVLHELEHLILDPDFMLESPRGGHSEKHSGVESVMEEALSMGLRGDPNNREVLGAITVGAKDYLFPDDHETMTVGEAITSCNATRACPT
jgi:hypothetical protein